MSKYEPETTLQAPIFLENDFEEDDDGISYVISSVFIGDEEDPQKEKPNDDARWYGEEESQKEIMLIGVVLIYASAFDVNSCDVLVCSENSFYNLESCEGQVKEDLGLMLNGMQRYARYKRYLMQGSN